MDYIQLKNVNKFYQIGSKDKIQVLNDINIKFNKGEFVSILGESGSGKSTLMNLIGGMDKNYYGDVVVEGKNLKGMKEKEIDAYRKLKIGFVFQSFNLISHLSVLDNVILTMQMTDMNATERKNKAERTLSELGLGDHLQKKPNQLSGGQKQRVAIARAMSNDPDILLADEPTGALDKKNSEQIMELLEDIAAKGKLVIAVTHSQKVANHGTRIITMDDGEIINDTSLKPAYVQGASKKEVKTKNLRFGAAFKMALNNIRLNLKRNMLVTFGGAIGILSVILMLGLGSGVTAYINDEVNSNLNPNLLQVSKSPEDDKSAQQALPNPVQESVPLKDEDIKTVENISHVSDVDPVFSVTMASSVNYNKSSVDIVQYQTMNKSVSKEELISGSLPLEGELLISETAAEKITDSPDSLIGETIEFFVNTMDNQDRPLILTEKMIVSGIIKGSMNQDLAYTTYETLEEMYDQEGVTLVATQLDVSVDNEANVDAVREELNQKGFKGTGVGSILSQVTNYLKIATYVLAGVAGISLLVSAIMIIVVLYISVVERTKEIGILRAVGARRKDVKRIFFSEAALLGLMSGVIGVVMANVIGVLGNNVMSQVFDATLIHISVGNMLIGLGVSIGMSVIAALLPSIKASKLDPIESLRYE